MAHQEIRNLPNLFVIGAAKCGTTSLHKYLDGHPEIAMSEPKEPGLFSFTPWRERIRGYEGMFDGDTPIRGESSTRYTYYPSVQDVPTRIAALVPDARLIYMVRDPVQRVIAHYVQQYAWMMEHRTLDSAIRDLDQPGNFYVAPSRYATQLEQWLKHFSLDRIMVIDQEDLRQRRHETVLRVLRFLGAEPVVPSGIDAEHNVGETKERLTPAAARLWFSLQPVVGRLPPGISGRLSAIGLFPIEKVGRPALSERMRKLLEIELEGEAQRFRELTGQAFASWSI